ncbi:MAG: MarR family winged helix-turn-helix transcriptional regulator [Roseburia sp.]
MQDHFLENYFKIEKAYRKFFWDEMEAYQLSPNEILVILFLSRSGEDGNTARDIARFEGVSKALVARSVEGLAERGYLTMERDASDKRMYHLHLTEDCGELVARIGEKQRIFFERLLDGIPEEHIQITKQTLERFVGNVSGVW